MRRFTGIARKAVALVAAALAAWAVPARAEAWQAGSDDALLLPKTRN
jgi:hypothetical protein